jgi:hypothetical protein
MDGNKMRVLVFFVDENIPILSQSFLVARVVSYPTASSVAADVCW